VIASLLRWIANRLDPPDDGFNEPLPVVNLFEDEGLAGKRRRNALELLDEETCGYVIVLLRNTHGLMQLVPEVALPHEAWPAMRYCLTAIAREAEGVGKK
jgi:hypothetical protein